MQNCLGDHEFQCWLKPHIKVQDCCITLTGNPTRLQRISRAVKCIPSVNPACFNYGVKFPIFAKVEVNGEQAHPLFDYLKKVAPFQGFDESDINAKLLKMMVADKAPEWLVNNELQYEMD